MLMSECLPVPVDNPARLTSVAPTCLREPLRVMTVAVGRRWPIRALGPLSARGCMAPVNQPPDTARTAPHGVAGWAAAAVIARRQNERDMEAVTTKSTG